ncbi:hypothetical protein DFJ74DRAFT_708696 [Hyaloraphidium curvatum]|nr:hypothetical protein DFJ74DRAFT_708696 [Hyaloraphidium curvatum]
MASPDPLLAALAGPASPALSAFAADEPLLTPAGERAALEHVARVFPKGSTFDGRALLDVFGGCEDAESDGRWAAVYGRGALVFVGCVWMGIRWMVEKGPGPDDISATADGRPLREALAEQEARFVARLRSRLARFWAADEKPRDAENLDLVAATIIIGSTFLIQQARVPAAAAMLVHAAAMLRATGLPTPQEVRAAAEAGGDELLIQRFYLDMAWANWAYLLVIATGSNAAAPPAMDLAAGWPRSAMPVVLRAVEDLMPPTRRKANAPVDLLLLEKLPTHDASRLLGWLGPVAPPGFFDDGDGGGVGEMLRTYLGDSEYLHVYYFGALAYLIRYRVVELQTWLRDEARMSLLELLVAEDEMGRMDASDPADHAPGTSRRKPRSRSRSTHHRLPVGSPLLLRAIERRRFLSAAAELVMDSLPADFRHASRASDLDEQRRVLASLPEDAFYQVHGHVAVFMQASMALSSPDPFVDPPEHHAGLLRVWLTSPFFSGACAPAIHISALFRAVAASDGGLADHHTFFVSAAGAATHAGWLHLLVLRRLSSRAPLAAQVRGPILADVQACLDVLEASAKPHHAEARMRLARALAGAADPEDAAVLSFPQAAGTHCRHSLGSPGACYECIAEGKGEDPVAAMPELAVRGRSKGKGRTVAFGDGGEGSGSLTSGGEGSLPSGGDADGSPREDREKMLDWVMEMRGLALRDGEGVEK